MEINGTENTTTETSTDEGIMTEAEALSSMMSSGNETVEETPQATDSTEITTNTGTEIDGADGDIDLSDVDLSFLGIEAVTSNEAQPGEIVETTQEGENNPLNDIKTMLENLNNPAATNPQTPELPEEEAQAVTELFNKFKQLGLIPENNGLSEEDKELLNRAKTIDEKLQQQEQEVKAYEEHQTKLSALDNFSKKLETTIPGYSTELIQKVVGDINKTNPDAAKKIFDNPALLIDLWNSVGAKSQPQQKPSNVIASNGQQNTSMNDLEQKVMNGTATEAEEARYLAQS